MNAPLVRAAVRRAFAPVLMALPFIVVWCR
jgi:hypothetical protein